MVVGEVIVAFVKNALCSLCTEIYVNGSPPTFQLQNDVVKNAWSEGLTHSSMVPVFRVLILKSTQSVKTIYPSSWDITSRSELCGCRLSEWF